VLDLCVRFGEALIATGAPVAETTAALLRVASGFGVTNTQIDITFISITASIDRDDDPLTKVRIINTRTADYSRLTDLYRLVEDIGAGRMSLLDAQSRFDQIITSPHPYRRFIATFALGLMAAGVVGMLGGGWLIAAVSAATTMLIDRVQRFLRHRNLPYLYQQVIGAGIATIVALLLLVGRDLFGWPMSLLPPSLVVAAGLVVLLAGMATVGAANDAISGYPLTAAARSFEVVLNTIGLVVGIGFVLDVGQRLGVPLYLSDTDPSGTPLLIQSLCGGMLAGAWALASYGRPRTLGLVLAIATAATAIRWTSDSLGLGPAEASFLAALAVGLLAAMVGNATRTPSYVLAVSGITPLLPGLAIYNGMFEIVNADNMVLGAGQLVAALAIGLALAAGVSLGTYLGEPFWSQTDRFTERVRERARGTRN